MYHIDIEPNAFNDLFDISAYYKEVGGMTLAETMTDRIYTQIETLKYMPSRCIISPYSSELRELIIQKAPYKVFFRIDEDRKVVSILTVIHTSRDITKLF